MTRKMSITTSRSFRCDLANLYKSLTQKKRLVLLSEEREALFSVTCQGLSKQPFITQANVSRGTRLSQQYPLNTRLASIHQITDNTIDTSNTNQQQGILGTTSENSFEERREITNFTEDARVVTESVTEITNLPISLIKHGDEPREHSVISFLKRPEKIAAVTWSTSDVKHHNLLSLSIPGDTLTTMYREKLKGFGLFRADIVLKLQFNSQPFQAGRLICTYTPVPKYLVDRFQQTRRSLCRSTSLPSVIIDISKQTEVNIPLPYISSFTHYDLTTGGGDWGIFDLWVYDPLSSASTQTVNIAVRAYYDNVRLGAPTQSSLVTASETLRPVIVQAEAQLGIEGMTKVTMREERDGPISNVGHDIRQAAYGILHGVGKNIPAISKIVDAVNNAAMAGLNIYASFGLGKPTNLDKIAPRCLHAFSNFATITGIDNGHMLALHGDNKIKMLPGFAGSDTDELSLTYLMQTLQYHDTHTITTSTNVGTMLASYQVSPFKFDLDTQLVLNTSVGTIHVRQPNLQTYIGSNFKYWRGDTVLHIGLIKTDYHSLRLKVVYDPMATNPANITYANSEYCYSVVIDFREKTDFYVRLPFISSTPWKNVPFDTQVSPNVPGEQLELLSTYCGYVAVFLDTELQASSAVVSNSVNMITEFCAADNFQFAYPMGGRSYIPIANTTPEISTPQEPTMIEAEAQFNAKAFVADGIMKTRSSMQNSTKDIKSITGLSPTSTDDKIPDYTTGEEVYSLRALIKRFNWILKTPSKLISLPSVPYIQYYTFTTGQPNQVQQCALVDSISALYAFRTGGFRYKAWDSSSNLITARAIPEHATSYVRDFTTIASAKNCGATGLCDMDAIVVKGGAEFQFPFYSPVYTFVNSFFREFVTQEPDLYFHFTQPQTTGLLSRDGGGEVFIAKAAGDDYNLGFLLGVPDCLPEQLTLQISGESPVPTAQNPYKINLNSITRS